MFVDDLLLFVEAFENKMHIVTNNLHKFCSMSDQEVIADKSNILFSKNVSRSVKVKLTQMFGFKDMNQLGEYLGVPLSGKALQKMDYQYLVDQVSARLANSETNVLSFTGRATLAKSVIEVIPTYPMMMNFLPKA